jgi:hypothetical protein
MISDPTPEEEARLDAIYERLANYNHDASAASLDLNVELPFLLDVIRWPLRGKYPADHRQVGSLRRDDDAGK